MNQRPRIWVEHALLHLLLGLYGSLYACSPSQPGDLPPELPLPIAGTGVRTYYLNAGGRRATLQFLQGERVGYYTEEEEGTDRVADLLLKDGWLHFRRVIERNEEGPQEQLFALQDLNGILRGRVKSQEGQYLTHATGWSHESLGGALTPRAYDLLLHGDRRAMLRMDRLADGRLGGRFKVYASTAKGALAEELEYDVSGLSFDGTTLHFCVPMENGSECFSALAYGRTLHGTYRTQDEGHPFYGTRADLLGYGLSPRSVQERTAYQERVRSQLRHLLQAGDPPPTKMTVTLGSKEGPYWGFSYADQRDDAPDQWPQEYERSNVTLHVEMQNPYGNTPLTREVHGVLTRPLAPPPKGGYPMVVALNGHSGSAMQLLHPSDPSFWYGDSFARRGYLVFALNIGHRPLVEREDLYNDYPDGDAPELGNGPHPAISPSGMDTDFEEDGERAFDVARAVDFLLSQPDGNRDWLVVTGLSMGAEVSTLAAALDPRIKAVVAAGFSPDFGVLMHHRNHPCWRLRYADLREYFDISDLHALIAPRPLIIETGTADDVFSSFPFAYAADKQVLRRSRAAYAEAPANLLHYLHKDTHHYHVGDATVWERESPGVQATLHFEPPEMDMASVDWQVDAETRSVGGTLYRVLALALGEGLPFQSRRSRIAGP